MKRITPTFCICVFVALGAAKLSEAQYGAPKGQWPYYAGDMGSTKYAPLGQINADNVKNLDVAWKWESPDNAIAKSNPRLIPFFYEATPLVVDGVMYVSTSLGQVAAINPETGDTVWVYNSESYKSGRPTNLGFVSRGVAYWTDGSDKRVFIGTGNGQLHCIDAKTGKRVADFANDGVIDLSQGLRHKANVHLYGVTSPPLVFKDLVIVGSSIFDVPSRKEMPPGDVRAFNVRTGALVWTFHNPPLPGEPGYDSWEDGSAAYTGNSNVWSVMSADPELGYVYLPFGTPTNDWYGGHRHGNGLFADSLVCVEGATGKLVWYYQFTHHGVWDYDLPAAPALLDVTVDGKKIKAVAQVTKQGFLYVFDRVTGKPVWPMKEEPVAASTVEGEKLSPTQPRPTLPKPFERQGISEADIIDFTPKLHEEAMEILKKYNYGPLHTPPAEDKPTLYLPGWEGGGNWCGCAADPETGMVYIPSITKPIAVTLARPDPARSNFRFIGRMDLSISGPEGLPLTKPPYGRITAIDLNTGDQAWQVAHGDGPRNHPALKDLKLPPLGDMRWGFPLTTKTLLIVAEDGARGRSDAFSPDDKFGTLRAFDKATGKVIWETRLPGGSHAGPMSYMANGRQFIAMAIGGVMEPAGIVAYALPAK